MSFLCQFKYFLCLFYIQHNTKSQATPKNPNPHKTIHPNQNTTKQQKKPRVPTNKTKSYKESSQTANTQIYKNLHFSKNNTPFPLFPIKKATQIFLSAFHSFTPNFITILQNLPEKCAVKMCGKNKPK